MKQRIEKEDKPLSLEETKRLLGADEALDIGEIEPGDLLLPGGVERICEKIKRAKKESSDFDAEDYIID